MKRSRHIMSSCPCTTCVCLLQGTPQYPRAASLSHLRGQLFKIGVEFATFCHIITASTIPNLHPGLHSRSVAQGKPHALARTAALGAIQRHSQSQPDLWGSGKTRPTLTTIQKNNNSHFFASVTSWYMHQLSTQLELIIPSPTSWVRSLSCTSSWQNCAKTCQQLKSTNASTVYQISSQEN